MEALTRSWDGTPREHALLWQLRKGRRWMRCDGLTFIPARLARGWPAKTISAAERRTRGPTSNANPLTPRRLPRRRPTRRFLVGIAP